jgi:quinol monooxygenase YgiN
LYLVVSVWEPLPGQEEAFEKQGMAVAAKMREQPGIALLEAFRSGSRRIVIHGYRDEATYQSLVSDPDGPFARAQAEYPVEKYGRWLYSERGETIPAS